MCDTLILYKRTSNFIVSLRLYTDDMFVAARDKSEIYKLNNLLKGDLLRQIYQEIILNP